MEKDTMKGDGSFIATFDEVKGVVTEKAYKEMKK